MAVISAQVKGRKLFMFKLIHPIPAFQDNYIWAIVSADENAFAVVDPGDPGPVLEFAKTHNLMLTHILVTHHHPDHTGGLVSLAEKYQPIIFGPRPSNIKGITDFVAEGDNIELFGARFSVLEVPGHTLDHIAYFSNDTAPPTLFCGDTLFAAGCGRLFEGTPAMMFESLAKLTALASSTAVYCTHEYTMANLKFAAAADGQNPALQSRVTAEQAKRDQAQPTLPSTIGLELATNPFVRCDDGEIIKRLKNQNSTALDSSVDVFAALRAWKDNF
jgi:hydroxyacylglutathione hydrolase